MQSNINQNILSQLIVDAQKDSIQKLVVGAVIRRSDKFLLLEREQSDFMGGLVEIPSGTVDEGEGLLLALKREVQEETGLKIHSVLSYLDSFDYLSASGKKARQFNFLVETELGDIVLNPKEHQAYHFLTSSDKELSTVNISDEVKAILKIGASLL
ncbi:MAG: NUDIX hydrolase [Candidatus Paceibacterota bacterium]